MSGVDKYELSRINYGIVLNDLVMVSDQEIELGDWTLRRASQDEIGQFRNELIRFTAAANSLNMFPSQEMNKIRTIHKTFQYSQIKERKDWRYMVIVPNGKESILGYKMAEALKISDWDLWVEWWSINGEINGKNVPQLGGSPFHCLRFLTERDDVTMTEKTCFVRLKQIISWRKKFDDEKYPAIAKALRMFREQDVNRESALKHLGYFAIIESILSHAPTANDSSGSISRQLKRNLVLLHNRMEPEYNLLFERFSGANPEKIISKLYSYRSSIAHGNNSEKDIEWLYNNFKISEVDDTPLRDEKQFISWYLRKLVQRILVQAINEPQLITDLKG